MNGLEIPIDYIALAIIAVLGVGGGLFLLAQARKYRARQAVPRPFQAE